MAKTRTYKVTLTTKNDAQVYCVEAASRAAAENHVRAKHIKAEVASGTEVRDMMKQGLDVEIANADPDTPQLPGTEQQ